MEPILIVGSGPAGMKAAVTLVGHGLRPVLVSEAAEPGGQGFRRLNKSMDLDPAAIYGPEADTYERLHRSFETILPGIDYHPETLVWALFDDTAHVLRKGQAREIPYGSLILAPGATDRVMPIKGWTLPGAYSLGAAQIALKDQGSFIGRRVVFAGSSPLLLLAALQYRKLGADDITILDTTPFLEKMRAVPDMCHSVRTFLQGLSQMRALKSLGVAVHHGVVLEEIEGECRVETIRFRNNRGETRRIQCDAVALGHGLRSETQLAELAGCEFAFDPDLRQWFPRADEDGRAGDRLYLAGDGAAIGGAEAAMASGALAAETLVADMGKGDFAATRRRLRRQVRKLRLFQKGLAGAFRWPHEAARTLADDVTVCRCESVSAGEIRNAVMGPLGPVEVNRVKAITRCGMGRCQGRFCGLALAEITAAAANRPIEAVGRLRAQAPVKPVPVSAGDVSS